jgi:AraC-like DNA-binding protein
VTKSIAPGGTTLDHASVWRSSDLPGVELMVGVNAGRRCRLLHESYAVCVIPYTGNANTVLTRWRYRGREYYYRPGSIGVEEPGETHTCLRVYSPIRYCMLRIDPQRMQEAARELGAGRVHFPETLVEHPDLFGIFQRFYQAAAGGASVLELETRLALFLRFLLADAGSPSPAPDSQPCRRSLEVARDYLEVNLARPVSLEELSSVAGLSRFHLSRSFAGRFGLSPHAYQNQLRLRAVREQLRQGRRLGSMESGFFDQSHMIRHFRDSLGMTPGEFAAPAPSLPPLG